MNSSTSLATTVLYEHARRIHLNVLRSVSHIVLQDYFNVCHFWIVRLGPKFPPAIYGLHYLETPSPSSNTFLWFAIQGVSRSRTSENRCDFRITQTCSTDVRRSSSESVCRLIVNQTPDSYYILRGNFRSIFLLQLPESRLYLTHQVR